MDETIIPKIVNFRTHTRMYVKLLKKYKKTIYIYIDIYIYIERERDRERERGREKDRVR